MTTIPNMPLGDAASSSAVRRERVLRETVLVVDDEPQLLELTELMLRTAGFRVLRADCAAECLSLLEQQLPDLILLDINLPDLCGFDLCQRIKANPITAGVPVMHLSGDHISSEEQALGLNAGADGYIARPITQYELIARVEAMLRVRRTEAELRKVSDELSKTTRAVQQMMDYSLDAICTIDAEGSFMEVSAAAEKMWGYSRSELIGQRFFDLVHPSDAVKSLSMFNAVQKGAPTRDFENRFIHKAGGAVMLMWSAYWSEADRKMFCVARDVTEGRVTERVLQRMAIRLQTTLENMSDAFYLLDREYCFTYINREAERLMQSPREELLHCCLWDAFPKAAESELRQHFAACFATNVPAHFELYYAPYQRWFEVNAFPSEEGLAVYFRDVTERKRSENMLAESHARFLNLVRATNHAMWDWDLDRNEVWWAEGFENRFGYDLSAINPKARFWYENIHPDDRGRVHRGLRNCIDSGDRVWSDEYRFRRADGSFAYVHDRGYVMQDEKGKPSRVVGGMLDMSERFEQERRLRESEERFRQLADNVEDAFWIMDAESREMVYMNPAFRRMHGGGSPVGYLDSVHPEDRERVRKGSQDIGNGYSDEHRLVRSDGSVISAWTRMVPVYDAEGKVYRIAGINTDITDRKRLERQVFRAQRMESIGTLAGGIAHDLNNVLTPIIMAVGLLRDKVADKEILETLEMMEFSAHRGADMVRQVLSFAKGVDGKRVRMQTRHLLKEIDKIVTETFPKNIDLRIAIAPELWSFVGDPTQIHQVLLNLCVNARDAMSSGGRINVRVGNEMIDETYAASNFEARPGRYVRIDVEDMGCGIAPDLHEKIFDPFYTTKEFGRGSGLGLSTSLAIVKSHGGFIRVTSEPGRGSIFTIHLPANEGEIEATEVCESKSLPRGNDELVLLVEDEAAVRTVTQQTLEAFGYRVLTAKDGVDAIAAFAQYQQDIAVVITDMNMPIMDGAATIEVLTRMDEKVKILAASGVGDSSRPGSRNVCSFLAKPYTAEDVLTALARTLGTVPVALG